MKPTLSYRIAAYATSILIRAVLVHQVAGCVPPSGPPAAPAPPVVVPAAGQ